MYRDISIGTAKPEVLKCILMALEKWMLSLGESKKEENHSLLIISTKKILENSNSVMTSSVISSISMAFPFILKEEFLPVFSVPDFFSWDNMRHLYKDKIYDFSFPKDTTHINERLEALRKKHRNENLESLIFKLSLYQDFLEPIFSVLDNHYKDISNSIEKNEAWQLALNRMDSRTYDKKENPNNENQIVITPIVQDNLKDFVDEGEKEREKERPILESINWVREILDKKNMDSNTFENWKTHQETVLGPSQFIPPQFVQSFKSVSAIAYIGLEYHLEKMDSNQLTWCINTVLETSMKILKDNQSGDLMRMSVGLFDDESVTKALPLILKLELDEDTNFITKALIIQTLLRLELSNNLQKPFLDSLVEKLWETHPLFASQCFRVLYNYSFLEKPRNHYHNETEYHQKLKIYNAAVEELITNGVNGELKEITLFEFDLDDFKSFYFDKVFNFLPEKSALTKELEAFRQSYEKTLISYTLKSKAEQNSHKRRENNLTANNLNYQDKSAKLLFYQKTEYCNNALTLTLNYILFPEDKNLLTYKTLELITGQLSQLITLENNIRKDERFWHLWNIIYDQSIKANSKHFSSLLLFKTRFTSFGSRLDWEPLHGHFNFIKNIIQNFGKNDIDAVVKLLSGAGAITLLPDGILWVKDIIYKNAPKKLTDIFYYERLVQRAFFIHRKAIQEDSVILKAYIYILNILVDAGSSSSFYLREIVMSKMD